MRRSTPHRPAAVAVLVAAFGATLAVATPAHACSCSYRGVEESLAAGHAVALVTGEAGPVRPGYSDAAETFRVEGSAGPALPARVTPGSTGEPCGMYVPPGRLTALVLERRPDSANWFVGGCPDAMLAPALLRILGDAVAVEGGAPVAYAAGAFGHARLTAIDGLGRTVGFDGLPGRGEQVARCPGGRTLAAVGLADAGESSGVRRVLTIHDAATLQVRRTVTLPQMPGSGVLALRCADARGRHVEIVVGPSADVTNRVLTVEGRDVTAQEFDTIGAAAPIPGGMLLAVGGRSTSLLHVGPAGTRTVAVLDGIAVEGGGSLAVSPDGRTAAIAGYRDSGPASLLTLDLRTGRRLGERTGRPSTTGLAWAGPDRLLVRAEHDGFSSPAALQVFDRRLTAVGESPVVTGAWGNHVTAVGRAGVVYGEGARLTTVPDSGAPLVADSLRLTAAAHVIAVPGGEFAPGAALPIAADDSGGGRTVGVLAAAVLAGAAAVAPALVRRRRRVPSANVRV